MRLLLVDMGNSRLKWAHLPAAEAQTGGVFMHRDTDMALQLKQAWSGLPVPDRVLVSCVASTDKKQTLRDWMMEHWQCQVDFLSSPAQGNGVRNCYSQPEQLGSDRWAAMVAVRARTSVPACVVNCGSAVTIDVIDQDGQHQGGLIMPGLHAMFDTLAVCTSLPHIDIPALAQLIPLGNSTRDAITSGVVQSVVALIEKTCAGVEHDTKSVTQCYIAGGDAPVISANLSVPHQVEIDLVLQGLAIIAQST